jgi:hypothetical protein
VVKTSEVLTFIDTLPSGMFDLPKGSSVRPLDLSPKRAVG